MPRTAAKITQAEVARAVRAVRDAGGGEIEIRDGTIKVIVPSASEKPVAPDREIVL